MIAVPKLHQFVPAVHAGSGDRLVQPFVAPSHDEDAENAGDVLFHVFPLEPSWELLGQDGGVVEGGPRPEKFLRSVLHLYENGLSLFRGAEQVEVDAPLFLARLDYLHIFELDTCYLVGFILQDSV